MCLWILPLVLYAPFFWNCMVFMPVLVTMTTIRNSDAMLMGFMLKLESLCYVDGIHVEIGKLTVVPKE